MATPIVAVRLPKDLIRGLRRVAHRESLRRDSEVSWVSVLKEAAERHIRLQEAQEVQTVGG